jgi:plasmid stabilization system protein ParE
MDKVIIYDDLVYFDFNSIVSYSFPDSKEKSKKFILEIMNFISRLEKFPNLGSVYFEDIRRLVFKNKYNIYYYIRKTEIIIFKIINSKLDK